MIPRHDVAELRELLEQFPAVALIGPRQSGKTTLARSLADVHYVDLERPSDRSRLGDAELYLGRLADSLVVLDEVQETPELFPVLRALIDEDRRPGRFLLLGSASPALLQRASQTLAGRIAFHELPPFRRSELPDVDWRAQWWRGGFPDAVLAGSDRRARRWHEAYQRTWVERDLALLGPNLQPALLGRFFAMVGHCHGQLWNGADLARSLGVRQRTVARYRDRLVDGFLLRELRPVHRNISKRLVRSPRVYFRDTGLLHAVWGVPDFDALQGHPGVGASFEGWVIEQLLRSLPSDLTPGFWRTHRGAEIDLVLERGQEVVAVVEVKYSSDPKPARGFWEARRDLGDPPAWVVHPGDARYLIAEGVEAIGVDELLLMASEMPLRGARR